MGYFLDQARLIKLFDREIDADEQRRCCRISVQPLTRLAASRFEHRLSDRKNQTCFFGHRNEVLRRHQSKLRMAPAYERFKSDQGAIVERDDRLIIDEKLISFARAAQ